MLSTLWFTIGLFHLVILTYQDIRHKKLVDDRHNWFMFGTTVSLLSLQFRSIKYILFLGILGLILTYFINKYKLMGEADSKTILWTFTGFGYLSLFGLVWYLVILLALYIIYSILNRIFSKFLFKIKVNTVPAYPIFLISFILAFWLFL